MQADPIAELRRLTEHYRELSDDELRDLAADLADLTETAQQALRTEMQSRGLRLAADPLVATNAPIASNAPHAAASYIRNQRAHPKPKARSFFARQPQLVPDTPTRRRTAESDGPG